MWRREREKKEKPEQNYCYYSFSCLQTSPQECFTLRLREFVGHKTLSFEFISNPKLFNELSLFAGT
jgi:hypothetical protein